MRSEISHCGALKRRDASNALGSSSRTHRMVIGWYRGELLTAGGSRMVYEENPWEVTEATANAVLPEQHSVTASSLEQAVEVYKRLPLQQRSGFFGFVIVVAMFLFSVPGSLWSLVDWLGPRASLLSGGILLVTSGTWSALVVAIAARLLVGPVYTAQFQEGSHELRPWNLGARLLLAMLMLVFLAPWGLLVGRVLFGITSIDSFLFQ
ncbi:MAG: hypothetical protein R3B96_17105 [Pirellulaceae bacterium]